MARPRSTRPQASKRLRDKVECRAKALLRVLRLFYFIFAVIGVVAASNLVDALLRQRPVAEIAATGYYLASGTDCPLPPASEFLFAGDQRQTDLLVRWRRVRYFCQEIVAAAQNYDLDPRLVAAVILQESGGQPFVTAQDGGVGLMQVMPREAPQMCPNGPCFADRPSALELENPTFNLNWGAEHLRNHLDRNGGDVREALRDYNSADRPFSYYADIVMLFYGYLTV